MKVLGRSHTSSSSSCSNSSSLPSLSASSSWIHVRSVLFIVASSSPAYRSYYRGHLKSPWFLRRRKHALSLQQWRSLFAPDGKLSDGGVNFFKKVRTGGVDPSIRTEVWPFLLGVFDVNSSKDERDILRTQKRKEYEDLRRQCQHLLKHLNDSFKEKETGGTHSHGGCPPDSEDVVSARESLSCEDRNQSVQCAEHPTSVSLDKDAGSKPFMDPIASAIDTESLGLDSSEDPRTSQTFPTTESREENDPDTLFQEDSAPSMMEVQSKFSNTEDFATWQRIIRLDAIRANGEWIAYAPAQTAVSDSKACHYAEAVGLEDYDHLEPCRVLHAARLVAILEAYTLFDPEIGYCQGMSDLLSPIIAVITEDYEAFWCFVGFMRKARHNFRLDEVGINRQLNIVSKIIKWKDSHLYRHLERLQAEDCFFVYRMVVVLFRRELTFEQTLFLWEVMWADQAAIRAGIGKSAWSRTRHRAPPTDDLLLYAIAASVLQRRKEIIEKYSSMEEIMRECNDMAGHLDVWKLLDDAHDLVATVHDKIEASF